MNEKPVQRYLVFRLKHFPENPFVALSANTIQEVTLLAEQISFSVVYQLLF
jgi:hypothetical protein